ncbi:hypothetical protein NONI108955_34325 [Nocardia ninae]|uniref:Uncharacterized protein n=1 Tax=Nocardia ninae NBRC 108245 TaxID=1210091 RepID=A0A511MRW2_9NOCA|nr:hypothetical protein [Nocardia ninae]GEM43342.1 hypothetical protein NN4_78610 [Nocardia ninae NBRC 108245]
MEREHEEAMRTEFTECVELWRATEPSEVSQADYNKAHDAIDRIDHRWQTGPHAEHWHYLNDAFEDWRRNPQTMRRFLDGVSYDRASGNHDGMTDTQYRSQLQARDVTEAQRARQRERSPRYR